MKELQAELSPTRGMWSVRICSMPQEALDLFSIATIGRESGTLRQTRGSCLQDVFGDFFAFGAIPGSDETRALAGGSVLARCSRRRWRS